MNASMRCWSILRVLAVIPARFLPWRQWLRARWSMSRATPVRWRAILPCLPAVAPTASQQYNRLICFLKPRTLKAFHCWSGCARDLLELAQDNVNLAIVGEQGSGWRRLLDD